MRCELCERGIRLLPKLNPDNYRELESEDLEALVKEVEDYAREHFDMGLEIYEELKFEKSSKHKYAIWGTGCDAAYLRILPVCEICFEEAKLALDQEEGCPGLLDPELKTACEEYLREFEGGKSDGERQSGGER